MYIMNKDILFIGATHGNEPVGITAVTAITQYTERFDLLVGNPRALTQQTRYTMTDLNRSAPGNSTSMLYEERRAADIIALSNQYRYVIDIHGAPNYMGIFIIITNPTKQNLQLASLFSDINRIVIWPSITPEMQYPLSEFFPCGIEIECGNKDAEATSLTLTKILSLFLEQYHTFDMSDDAVQQRLATKELFMMYGKQSPDTSIDIQTLREFEHVTIQQESFYPAFISTYDYTDVLCYKLKKISLHDVTDL